MAGGVKKSVDDLLAQQLATGATVPDAARLVGISATTAYRRMRDLQFRSKVAEMRHAAIESAVSTLSASSSQAAKTLEKLASSAASEQAQLGAARSILEFALRGVELLDITARLDALEQQMTQQQKDKEQEIPNGQPRS